MSPSQIKSPNSEATGSLTQNGRENVEINWDTNDCFLYNFLLLEEG